MFVSTVTRLQDGLDVRWRNCVTVEDIGPSFGKSESSGYKDLRQIGKDGSDELGDQE